MNELSILMHLLSKKNNNFQIGATEEEILDLLNIKDKNKSFKFQKLINYLSYHVELLGLQVRFNPLDSHWFLTFDQDLSDLISANPFEDLPRLGATLFYTLASCFNNSGVGKINEIRNLRKKKFIMEDLKELEKLGYIKIEMYDGEVKLTPLIGYKLDLNSLFVKVALKLKE